MVVPDRDAGDSVGLAGEDRPEALELSASGTRPSPIPDEHVDLICRLARENPRWGYLRSQAQSLLATDFFHVDAVNGQRYYAPFAIEIERRVVHLLGVTTNLNGHWVTQMARNLVWDLEEAKRAIRFLIGDRDTKFTAAFGEVLRSAGIETVRTPVRAPRANAGWRQSEPSASITC